MRASEALTYCVDTAKICRDLFSYLSRYAFLGLYGLYFHTVMCLDVEAMHPEVHTFLRLQ